MGAIFWVLKMVLKVLKPFAKIAIIESLIEALMGSLGEDEATTPTDATTSTDGE